MSYEFQSLLDVACHSYGRLQVSLHIPFSHSYLAIPVLHGIDRNFAFAISILFVKGMSCSPKGNALSLSDENLPVIVKDGVVEHCRCFFLFHGLMIIVRE